MTHNPNRDYVTFLKVWFIGSAVFALGLILYLLFITQ